MAEVPGDVAAVPEANGAWVLMNVRSRTCLGVGSEVLDLLSQIQSQDESALVAKDGEQRYRVWDIHWFSNEAGLLADPTRYRRDVSQWPAVQLLDVTSAIAQLKQHFLVVDDPTAYRARFALKRSFLDWERFGNFHQQLGQHLMLLRRENPSTWWLRQKFNDDLQSLKPNLYQAVQGHYLEGYFPQRLGSGVTVLDVGCGAGFYSNMMARTGASVLGIDPNEEYIRLARESAVQGARFEVMTIGVSGNLTGLPAEHFDYVFMSDALLFYFVPSAPQQVAELSALFEGIRRILKPNGLFISLEPHSIFFLLPWLGAADHPFTVLTEYLNRTFAITPNFSDLIQAYASGGFVVTWMDELRPDPSFEAIDPRAFHFARQFPLWHLFELRRG